MVPFACGVVRIILIRYACAASQRIGTVSGKFELFITTGAIVVVAASTAVILWSGAGLAWHYAAIAGLLISALMIPLALRGRGGAASSGRVKNLEAKLDTLGRRLQTLEQKLVEVDEKMVHYS